MKGFARGSLFASPLVALLVEALGVPPPFVGELEEEGTASGVLGLLSGASTVVRVLLVEASERRHGTYFPREGGPDIPPFAYVAERCGMVQVLAVNNRDGCN
jgi:hypothetical protein